MTTLDQVLIGGRCRIAALTGPAPLCQRFLELGLMEGEEVVILARAPLGDPIEIESVLSRVSLRRSEAAQIQVTPLG